MAKAKSTLGRMSGVMKAAVRKAAQASESNGDSKASGLTMPPTKSERKTSRKYGVAPVAKSATRKPAV
jgi:hypothetical protein